MTDNHQSDDFQFVIPTEDVLAQALSLLRSDEQSHRDIGKVVCELTSIQKRVQEEILNNGTVDLDPWFDYWFGDTSETAWNLKDSDTDGISSVAKTLLEQEAALIHSKEIFLNKMKRLNVQPNYED